MTVTWRAALARGPCCRRRPGRSRRSCRGRPRSPRPRRAAASESRGAVTSTPRTSRPPQHDLLDVEHLDAGARERREHRGGHAGPVLAGQRDQQGLRRFAGVRVSHRQWPRLSAGGVAVGGRRPCWSHGQHPSRDRLHRVQRDATWPPRTRSTSRPSAGGSTTTGPSTPASVGPDGDGEVGGLNAVGVSRAAAAPWCCSTPTTSTPPSRRSGRPAARSSRVPTSSRAGAGSTSPTRAATSSASGPSCERPGRRPHLGRAGGDQRPPCRRGRGAQGGSRRARSRTPLTRPAVVLERQVDDVERLQPARGQVDAARRARRRERRTGVAVPQVHQLVGDLGPPAGDVERGERVGRVRAARRAARGRPRRGRAAGGARRACAAQATAAPARCGTRPRPVPSTHHRLAGLERVGVERRRARPARPGRPRPGTPRRRRSRPAARSRPRAPTRVSVPSAPGQPGDVVGRVVAEDGVDDAGR